MKSPSRVLGVLAVALGATGGCATRYGPPALPPGSTLEDITGALGRPTARHALADGERLEYARGPYGRHTYMVDLDAQGRLSGWQQVLTEPRFQAIRPGMTRDEVRLALGRPADTQRIAWQHRTLWSYRYETPFCQWFQVGLDANERVVDASYGPDPLCDVSLGDNGP